MIVRSISVDDVPIDLLKSKEWDSQTVLDLARESPGWRWLRVEEDDGRIVAIFTMHRDAIYDCIFVDTLIMMPEHKGVVNLKKVFRIAGAVAFAYRKEVGARGVRMSTLVAEKVVKRILDGMPWKIKPVAYIFEATEEN